MGVLSWTWTDESWPFVSVGNVWKLLSIYGYKLSRDNVDIDLNNDSIVKNIKIILNNLYRGIMSLISKQISTQ